MLLCAWVGATVTIIARSTTSLVVPNNLNSTCHSEERSDAAIPDSVARALVGNGHAAKNVQFPAVLAPSILLRM